MTNGRPRSTIDTVFFDIGGVLGTNGWDREQRATAAAHFGLDAEDFQYRHEEMVGALESGEIDFDEYLDVVVFSEPRAFDRDTFREYVFSLSEPWPESIAVARELAASGVRLFTLNNESEALNRYRIERFGLCGLFSAFLSSCWLRATKPTHALYKRALGIAQAAPERTLMIDDRMQNLRPAARLGMEIVQFESAGGLRSRLERLGMLDDSHPRRSEKEQP
jgi:putative hydrolase of the HAD superfamily